MKDVMKTSDNSFGVMSVVFGILGVVSLWIPFIGILFGILSFIFAYVQKRRMHNSWVTAGMWLGIIAVALSIIWWVVYVKVVIPYIVAQTQQFAASQQGNIAGGVDLNAYSAGN